MRRYYYNEKMSQGQNLVIQGDLFHHIFEVCRLQPGQHFELLNEQGKAFLALVNQVSKKSATITLCEERVLPVLKEPLVYLYLSFPKVSTFEAVVEKSVEMGVKTIIPFLSDFSHFRTVQQFPSEKMFRWKKIILQATQQSGRSDLMTIEEVKTLSDLINQIDRSSSQVLNIISYEGEAPVTLKEHISKIRSAHQGGTKINRVNLFVGSEGGFSEKEVETFKKLDLIPVTLGDQILRVETACMTLVASIKYEFDI